jgi:DNA-binding response OmpR family regulator
LGGRMAKILVADDEAPILELLRRRLESAGHAVVTVADGQQALKLVQSDDFDLYVLDVKMPRLDGYSLAHSIKKRFPERKVVLITALDTQKYEVMTNACGADMTISKPFDGDEFMRQIAGFIEAPHA